MQQLLKYKAFETKYLSTQPYLWFLNKINRSKIGFDIQDFMKVNNAFLSIKLLYFFVLYI